MKTILSLPIFLIFTLNCLADDFYIYTAKSDGIFSNLTNWNKVKRMDGVQRDEFIIPTLITVTADDNISSMNLGDITLKIFGILKMGNNVKVYLSSNSRIEIMRTGSIDGEGNSQQIFIGNVLKYEGNKNKILTGPKFSDKTTGVAPSAFSSFAMLPVHFLNFVASKNNDNSVLLKWSTADEVNNNRFEIERTSNGTDWTVIGVCSAKGTRTGINNYNFTDNSKTASQTSYRIKQIDNNNQFTYSTVAMIRHNGLKAGAKIYSSNKTINIEFNQEINSEMNMKVFNINGNQVSNHSIKQASGKITFNISNLNKGIYVVQVTGNNSFSEVKKISIN